MDHMEELKIEGVPQRDLNLCMQKIEEIQKWAKQEKLDRWAIRAALLKALNEDAEEFFEKTKGTFREIAAFDNGVATVIDAQSHKK